MRGLVPPTGSGEVKGILHVALEDLEVPESVGTRQLLGEPVKDSATEMTGQERRLLIVGIVGGGVTAQE